MITTTGRFPEEPLPRPRSDSTEAPEFTVTFSRRSDMASRAAGRANSFRWSGNGTIRVMERGLLVIAKRRSALGFLTTEKRLIPAWEICDVYREGFTVRVYLRSDTPHREFFQFRAADASMAGTIVRLVPTKRIIEYEEPPLAPSRRDSGSSPDRRVARTDMLIPAAFIAALLGLVLLLTVPRLRDYISPPGTEAGSSRQTAAASSHQTAALSSLRTAAVSPLQTAATASLQPGVAAAPRTGTAARSGGSGNGVSAPGSGSRGIPPTWRSPTRVCEP